MAAPIPLVPPVMSATLMLKLHICDVSKIYSFKLNISIVKINNFYVQLFAETGIIGLTLGCTMFISIIVVCYRCRRENFNCPMHATAFVVPFGLFFPFQQFGSFYGQWGNLFMWFALGFALSQCQNWKKN